MPEQYNLSDRDERRFAGQCQADAKGCQPAFSEALHKQIMAAVRAGQKNDLGPPIPGRRWGRRVRIAVAIAASLLILAVGAWRYPWRQTAAAPASQQVAAGGTGQRSRPVPAVVSPEPVMAGVQNYSLDDLNRGAGLAVKLVVDRLPLDVPTDDWVLPTTE